VAVAAIVNAHKQEFVFGGGGHRSWV
jgi:hypothetical protein